MIKLIGIGILGFFLMLFQKILYEKLWYRHLHVNISFREDHIFQGEQGELKEIIENRKWLPLSMLKVKFKTDRRLLFDNHKGSRTTDQYYRNDVFRIGGSEKVTRTLKFTGGRRGYYTIDEVSLVASDLFFLNQMMDEQRIEEAVLYVYPKPYDSSKLMQSLIQINGEILSKRHLLEDPFEYRGIREYQPYDDMRRINWKATAKTDEFKVNELNYTSLKSVRIFFNIQDNNILRKEESVEISLQIVASLCTFFLRQGMRVSCYGNGVDIVTHLPMSIKVNAGQGQMDTIYRALARIDTKQPVPDFGEMFREQLFQHDDGVFTCFVSANQYDDFVELLNQYRKANKLFRWFYPVSGQQKPKLPHELEKYISVIYPQI